jgi:hypothetical protein
MQWAAVIVQIWVFGWTVRRDALDLSLWDVFLGNDYFREFWREFWKNFGLEIRFPHGGIYFCFFILLISFFIMRNAYRLNQIRAAKDKAQQTATLISLVAVTVPLFYLAILAFAANVYPYIPYEKGGGNYANCPPVHIEFNINATTPSGYAISIPADLVTKSVSNYLVVLDENSSSVFLASTNSRAGGPMNWITGKRPPVYEIPREAVGCISYRRK